MELRSKIAKNHEPAETVSDQVIRHYIAQMEAPATQPVTDPTMLQPGQTLVDSTGQSMQVVENDPTTTNVVLAPVDEAQNMPEGVTTVEDTDLSTQYTMNSGEY